MSIEQEIKDWHIATFPNANNKAILDKAFEEMREFTAEAVHGYDDMYEEAADVVIVLIALFERNNRHLLEYVHHKMEVNKKRIWGEEDKNGGKPRVY